MERCGGCQKTGTLGSTREDGWVCNDCGWVSMEAPLIGDYNMYAKGNTVFHTLSEDNRYKTTRKRKRAGVEEEDLEEEEKEALETTYRRIFHFNERLTQLNLCEPGIPLELFNLIVQRYYSRLQAKEEPTPLPDELTKDDVKRLCNEIEVPEDLQERYRSKKFKKNAHTDMRRYAEKWMSIRARLGGYRPPKLEEGQVKEIRDLFCEAEGAFKKIRHKPECKGEKDCHKGEAACRHNFLNYNYVILQLLKRMGVHETYLPWFPQLKTKDKLENLNHYWEMMCKELGWEFEKVVSVSDEEEQTSNGWERAIPVPQVQAFQKDASLPDSEQERKVRQWASLLRKQPFCYKSKDDHLTEVPPKEYTEEDPVFQKRLDDFCGSD